MISLKVFDTPIKINVKMLLLIPVLWGCLTWLGFYWHPERSLLSGLLIGLSSAILLLTAEYGHPLAHIFSARFAGAPMKEILISTDMARTLYPDDKVSPNVHRIRALGGPIFNLLGLLLSLAIFGVTAGNSIIRELAGWSALGHGLLLVMSLTPVSIVDGGTLLKWTLVAGGKTEGEADDILRRVDWSIGIGMLITGAGLIAMRMWIASAILIGFGLLVSGVAVGKIH